MRGRVSEASESSGGAGASIPPSYLPDKGLSTTASNLISTEPKVLVYDLSGNGHTVLELNDGCELPCSIWPLIVQRLYCCSRYLAAGYGGLKLLASIKNKEQWHC